MKYFKVKFDYNAVNSKGKETIEVDTMVMAESSSSAFCKIRKLEEEMSLRMGYRLITTPSIDEAEVTEIAYKAYYDKVEQTRKEIDSLLDSMASLL